MEGQAEKPPLLAMVPPYSGRQAGNQPFAAPAQVPGSSPLWLHSLPRGSCCRGGCPHRDMRCPPGFLRLQWAWVVPLLLSPQGISALKIIPEPKRPRSGLPCTLGAHLHARVAQPGFHFQGVPSPPPLPPPAETDAWPCCQGWADTRTAPTSVGPVSSLFRP